MRGFPARFGLPYPGEGKSHTPPARAHPRVLTSSCSPKGSLAARATPGHPSFKYIQIFKYKYMHKYTYIKWFLRHLGMDQILPSPLWVRPSPTTPSRGRSGAFCPRKVISKAKTNKKNPTKLKKYVVGSGDLHPLLLETMFLLSLKWCFYPHLSSGFLTI